MRQPSKIYNLKKIKQERLKRITVADALRLIDIIKIGVRTNYCKVRGCDVTEYLVPYDSIDRDVLSQIRLNDCDTKGVAQLANEIASEDQDRGLCVRPKMDENGELKLYVAWGNTGFRAMGEINSNPGKFAIGEYKLGYAWVNLYDKPEDELSLWQGKENNSHSYSRSASREDNLAVLRRAVEDGKLDEKPKDGENIKFDDLLEADKKKKVRAFVKEWLTKERSQFADFYRNFQKKDPHRFPINSFTPEELKKYASTVGFLGIPGDKVWKDCVKNIGGYADIFEHKGRKIKVSCFSENYINAGAHMMHGFGAVYVEKVADEVHFVLAVKGDTKKELDETRNKLVKEAQKWNAALGGGKKYIWELWFVNQCTQVEVNSGRAWARHEKL